MSSPVFSGVRSSSFFFPYFYTRENYTILSTPLGAVNLRGPLHQYYPTIALIGSVVCILLLSLLIYGSVRVLRYLLSSTGLYKPRGAGSRRSQYASALHESIHKKGETSYYYAHNRKVVGEEAEKVGEWDGQAAPRLLRREVRSEAAAKSNESGTNNSKVHRRAITQYAWSDEGKVVKIYVEVAGTKDLPESNLDLNWSSSSLSFSVRTDADVEHCLQIPALFSTISDANLRRKNDKFILTLNKKMASTSSTLGNGAQVWTSLKPDKPKLTKTDKGGI